MADMLTKLTTNLIALSDVKRWVVIKTTRTQSVAEHSYNVMVIATELMTRLGTNRPHLIAEMYKWAMMHDMPECLTGDINGKFKRDNPKLRLGLVDAECRTFPAYEAVSNSVSSYVKAVVKAADKIEAMAFIRVWGVGRRAHDVYNELREILTGPICERLHREGQLGFPTDWKGSKESLAHMCVRICENIEGEVGSIQFEGGPLSQSHP